MITYLFIRLEEKKNMIKFGIKNKNQNLLEKIVA